MLLFVKDLAIVYAGPFGPLGPRDKGQQAK